MKNKRKEGGYVLILALLFSITILFMVSRDVENTVKSLDEKKKEDVVFRTSEQLVDFSTAVTKVIAGIGASPGDVITVDQLKNIKLLPKGFSEKTLLGNELKGYYVTNPKNKNIVDIMIAFEGDVDKKRLEFFGYGTEDQNIVYKNIIRHAKKIGFPAKDLSEKFYIGLIDTKRKILESDNNEINISHLNFNVSDGSIGVYQTASNQIGWWRMQVGPYLWQPKPSYGISPDGDDDLRLAYFGPTPASVINDGFSYFCPESYTKIDFNQEIEINERNLNSGGPKNLYFCIKTYKGTVKKDISDKPSAQLFNAVNSDSPLPAGNRPDIWGRCVPHTAYFDAKVFNPRYRCVPSVSDLVNMTDEKKISGLNNELIVDSWDMAKDNGNINYMYNKDFIGKHDFYAPNGIFANGMVMKIDERYLRVYSMSGSFITGGGKKYSEGGSNFNTMSALGLKVSKDMPERFIDITESYNDANRSRQTMNIRIPTPIMNN